MDVAQLQGLYRTALLKLKSEACGPGEAESEDVKRQTPIFQRRPQQDPADEAARALRSLWKLPTALSLSGLNPAMPRRIKHAHE
jgi:hypothetical protein